MPAAKHRTDGRLVDGVAPGGLCLAGWEERNAEAHDGYVCPRDWYIYHSGDVTLTTVCEEWGLLTTTVHGWMKAGAWELIRQRRLEKIRQGVEKVYDEAELVKKRAEWIDERVRIAAKVIKTAEKMMDSGEEDALSPTGETVQIKMKAGSLKALSAVMTEQMENISVALGVPTKLTGQFAGATVDARQVTVASMTVLPPAGLPAPRVTGVPALAFGDFPERRTASDAAAAEAVLDGEVMP